MSIALKSWAGALHPDSQWSIDLKPANVSAGKPTVSFVGGSWRSSGELAAGMLMAASRPAIPEPDWLSPQAEDWLDIIDATSVEERHRIAANQVTASLRDLRSTRDLHDAHPVIRSLIEAIEQRDVAAYSHAHNQLRQVEQTRRDQSLRQHTESVIRATIPGFIEAVALDVDNPAWDDRFADWEEAWRWAIADNWLQKRSDFTYQQELWQRRHDTEKVIGKLLAEAASLHAWTHFFNRINNKPSVRAALNGWRGVCPDIWWPK